MGTPVPADKYTDLIKDYCGPTAVTCYNNPNSCGDLFVKFVKSTTDLSEPPAGSGYYSIFHEICDEAKKTTGSKITDNTIRNNVLNACNGLYATKNCTSGISRYSSKFSNKEQFSGSCIDMCSTATDTDTKIACLAGTMGYCTSNNLKNVADDTTNCDFTKYFNPDKSLKNIEVSDVATTFSNTYKNDINNFQTKYCQVTKDTTSSYCKSTVPVVNTPQPSTTTSTPQSTATDPQPATTVAAHRASESNKPEDATVVTPTTASTPNNNKSAFSTTVIILIVIGALIICLITAVIIKRKFMNKKNKIRPYNDE